MKRKLLSLGVILFLGSTSIAQQGDGGVPHGTNMKELLSHVDTRTFAEPDIEALRAEDAITDAEKTGPWRFGYNNYTDLNFENSGTWIDLANGGKIWQIHLNCTNALTVNLTFENLTIPEGNELYVFNPNKTFILGKFTSNHLYEGVLGTELVPGNEAIVEYYVAPENVDVERSLTITRVTHGYRTAEEFIEKAFGSSGSCNMNVACPDGAPYDNQIRATVMLVSGSSGFCTGSMINNCNNDGKPYVLTANHCYSNPASWIFRFNWQSSTCSNPATSPSFVSLSGAVLRARRTPSDFCLVEITGGLEGGTVPASYNTYFPGWDHSDTPPTSAVCVHHPDGDIKKISFDDNPLTSGNGMGSSENNSQWVLVWDRNTTTEPGSSGSPLFDQNGRIVGQLWGGGASCSNLTAPDYYGKVSYSWNPASSNSSNHLVSWLDPCNSGINTLDGYDPNGPAATDDAGVLMITSPAGDMCDGTFTPELTLKNFGANALTEANIIYNLDGGSNITYGWTGNLAPNSTETITLPNMTASGAGAHTFTAYTDVPNGNTDGNNVNDQAVSNFTLTADESSVYVTVNIHTDNYADEVYMEIVKADGTVVWTEGNENVAGNYNTGTFPPAADPTNALVNDTDYSWDVSLNPSSCYTFTIYDYYGDGLGAGGTGAGYDVLNNSGAIMFSESTADFGGEESGLFKMTVGIEELNQSLFNVYPNPSNGVFNIRFANEGKSDINVLDITGRTIYSGVSNSSQYILDLNNVSNGTYLLKVEQDGIVTTKSIIVRK